MSGERNRANLRLLDGVLSGMDEEQIDEAERLRFTLEKARTKEPNPDSFAHQVDVGQRADMPSVVVKGRMNEAQRRAEINDLDIPKLSMHAPITATTVANDEQLAAMFPAAKILDMSFIERLLGDISQQFTSGVLHEKRETILRRIFAGKEDPLDQFRLRELQPPTQRNFQLDALGVGGGGGLLGEFGRDVAGVFLPGVAREVPGLIAGQAANLASMTEASGIGALASGAIFAAGGLAIGGPGGAVAGFKAGAPIGGFLFGIGDAIESSVLEVFGEIRDFQDATGERLGDELARPISLAAGTLMGLVEGISAKFLLRQLPGGGELLHGFGFDTLKRAIAAPTFRSAVKHMATDFGFGFLAEGSAETTQESIKILAELHVHDRQGKTAEAFKHIVSQPDGSEVQLSGWEAALARITEAGIKGALVGGPLAGGASSLRLTVDSARARNTERLQRATGRLVRAAEASPVRKENPDIFQAHVQRLVDEDVTVDTVHVDAEAVHSFFQGDADEDAKAEIFENVPALGEQKAEVEASGATYAIPTAQFMTHIIGTDMYTAVAADTAFGDVMTPNELAQDAERRVAEFASLTEQAGLAEEETETVRFVREAISGQLEKEFPANTAEAYTTVALARIQTAAARLGITVGELLERRGIFQVDPSIAPREGEEAQPTVSEKLTRFRMRRLIGDLRSGRNRVIEGLDQRPIIAALIRMGGVDRDTPAGAQLREILDVKKGLELSPKAGGDPRLRGLFRGPSFVHSGLDANDLGLEEIFHGNISTVDPTSDTIPVPDLMEAVADEVMGRAILRTPEQNELIGENLQERNQVEGELERLGIDLQGDLTDEQIVEALFQDRFEQPGGKGPRASVDLSDITAPIIRFTKARDLSSFFHESGHIWLAELEADVASELSTQQLRRDLAVVREWLGMKDGQEFSTAQHERWAEGVEKFILEGKAPSVELRSVFQRFSDWLARIYKTLRHKHFNKLPITNEIREVMGRLIATDEQIAEAKAMRGIEPLFLEREQFGGTDEQWATFRENIDRALDAGKISMRSKAMREMRRREGAEWKKRRGQVRKEIEAEVNNEPLWQAQHWLRTGKFLPGHEIEGVERQRMNRDAVNELVGEDASLVLGRGRNSLTQAKGGLHPDDVAAMFGYDPGGASMVNALSAMQSRAKEIDQRMDLTMRERFGELQTSEQVSQEVTDTLASDAAINVLLEESKALSRLTGTKTTPLKILRAIAKDTANRTRIVRANPDRMRRSALSAGRAAEQAVADGDIEGARNAKHKQMFSVILEAEFRKRMKEANKNREHFDSLMNPKNARRVKIIRAGGDYWNAISSLLARFDNRKITNKRVEGQIAAAMDMEAFLNGIEEQGDMTTVSPAMRDRNFVLNWREMTFAQQQEMRDAVDNIAHLAVREREFVVGSEHRTIDGVADELAASAEKHVGFKIDPEPISKDASKALKNFGIGIGGHLLKWDVMHRKMLDILDQLDGEDPNGPWKKYIWRPLGEDQRQMKEKMAEFSLEFAADISRLTKGREKSYSIVKNYPELEGTTIDTELGDRRQFLPEFNKQALLGVALNMLNPSNRQKLLEGFGWQGKGRAVMTVLHQELDERDWEFVRRQAILLDSLWVDIERQARLLSGVVPERIEGINIETPFGSIAGGYFPVIFDHKRLSREKIRLRDVGKTPARESLFAQENKSFVALTAHGHEKKRVRTARPLQLSIYNIPKHMEMVLHDLTHREDLLRIHKIVTHPKVKQALDESLGQDTRKLFRPWLQRIADDRISTTSEYEPRDVFLRKIRTAAIVYTLGLRPKTLIMQTAGHFVSYAYFNGKKPDGTRRLPNFRRHYLDGLRRLRVDMDSGDRQKATIESIEELSLFMKQRPGTIDRDQQEIIEQAFDPEAPLFETKFERSAKKAAMLYIGKWQYYLVDIPVWLTAYNGGFIEFGLEGDAQVAFADQAVEQTQAAAGPMALSEAQVGGELYRSMVMFYSFFGQLYQQLRRSVVGLADRGVKDMPHFLAQVGWKLTMPGLYSKLIRALLNQATGRPGEEFPEDPDPIALMAYLTTLTAAEGLNSVVFARDIAGIVAEAGGSGHYFRADTPLQQLYEEARDLSASFQGDNPVDINEATWDMIRIITLARGLPLGEANPFLERLSDELLEKHAR